jgi:hypothetical protein
MRRRGRGFLAFIERVHNLLQCSDEGWAEHRMRTGEADRAQESGYDSLQYTSTTKKKAVQTIGLNGFVRF